MIADDQVRDAILGPAWVGNEGTIMENVRREISLVYRFEEGPDSGTELIVCCSDTDHSFTGSITDIPTGKLLWTETSRSNRPLLRGSIKDYVRDSFLPLIGLATRLAKDSTRAD
jgi:hypothetical protein